MADAKRQVNIQLDVIGNAVTKITGIGTKLTALKNILDPLTAGADKTAKSMDTLAANLSKLTDFQPPDLKGFNRSVTALAKVDANALTSVLGALKSFKQLTPPKSFTEFTEGLRKISSVKSNENLVTIRKQISKFEGMGNLPSSKLRTLAAALLDFTAVKGLPGKGLDTFADSLRKVNTISGYKPASLSKTAAALREYIGISLPNRGLASFAAGLTELNKVNLKDSTNLRAIGTALASFRELGGKLPTFGTFAAGLERLTKLDPSKLTTFATALEKLGTAMHTLPGAEGVSSAFTQVSKGAKSAGEQVEEMGKRVKTTTAIYKDFIRRLRQYTAYRIIADSIIRIKEAFIAGLTEIVAYDQALKDLQAITNATDIQVEQMGKTILDVARSTKFSASEVAAGMRTLGQAGFSSSESIQAMQGVADLATGTLSDMSTTVDLVTTALRVFDIQASSTGHVVDVFGNAVNRSKLTIDKLRIAMNYVGPIAHEAGVTFEEMAAAMATLANSGLRASTIGTGLRRVFAELLDPSKGFSDAIDEAGLTLEQLDPRINSLSVVLGKLRDVISDSSVAFEAFGKRGAAAALALADSDQGFTQMLDVLNESGAAARMAATQMEGLGVQIKNLRDRLGVLAIALGKSGVAGILQALVTVARGVTIALEFLADNVITAFIIKATSLFLLLGSLNLVFRLLPLLVVKTATGFGKLRVATDAAAVSAARTTKVLNLLSLAIGRIGIVIAVIIGVYSAFTYWTDRFNRSLQAASDAAAEFGNKLATFRDYEESIIGLAEGSLELEKANKGLRDSLLEVAGSIPEVADAAYAAAQSINASTGEIIDNGEALKAYKAELAELELANIVTAFKAASDNLIEQTRYTNQGLNIFVQGAKDAFNQFSADLEGVLQEAAEKDFIGFYTKLVLRKIGPFKAAWKTLINAIKDKSIPEAIQAGTASFEDLQKYVDNLDLKNMTEQQKDVKKAFELLRAEASNTLTHLLKTGQVDMDTPIHDVQQLALDLGLTSQQASALVGHFQAVVERVGKIPNTGIKGLSDEFADGVGYVEEYLLAHEELQTRLGAGAVKEVQNFDARRKAIADQYDAVRELYEAEIKSGVDKEVAYKRFAEAVMGLDKQRQDLEKEGFKIASYYTVKKIKEAEREYDIQVEINNKSILDYKKRIEANLKAEQEFQAKKERLLTNPYDPAKLKKELEDENRVREKAFKDRIYAINRLEAEDFENTQNYNAMRLDEEAAYLDEKVAKTQAYFNTVKELTQNDTTSEEFIDAQQDMMDAVEERAEFHKQKILEIEQAEKGLYNQLVTLNDKLKEAAKQAGEKILELQRQFAEKRKQIENDAAEKIGKINEKLDRDLEALEQERLQRAKNRAQGVRDLEATLADDLRAIRQRSMTEKQKEADNLRAIAEKRAKGLAIAEQGLRKNDRQRYEEGMKLIEQAYSMANAVEDQNRAYQLVNGIMQERIELQKKSKKFDEYEVGVKEETLRTDASDDIDKVGADAAAAQQAAQEAYLKAVEEARNSLRETVSTTNVAVKELEEKIRRNREELDALKKERQQYEVERQAADDARKASDSEQQTEAAKPQNAADTGGGAEGEVTPATATSLEPFVQGQQEALSQIEALSQKSLAAVIQSGKDAQAELTNTFELMQQNFDQEGNYIVYKVKPEINDEEIEQEVLKVRRSFAETVPLNIDQTSIDATTQKVTQLGLPVNTPLTVDQTSVDMAVAKVDKFDDLIILPLNVDQTSVDETIVKVNALDGRITRSTHIITTIMEGATEGALAFSGGLIGSLVQQFAGGGQVFKKLSSRFITKGSGLRDDVAALLSKNEFVQPASAVNKYGVRFMEMIRRGLFPVENALKYASGGVVSPTSDMLSSLGSVQLDSSRFSKAVGNVDVGSGTVSNVSNWSMYFGDKAFSVPDDVRSPALNLMDAVRRRI